MEVNNAEPETLFSLKIHITQLTNATNHTESLYSSDFPFETHFFN